MLDWTHNDSPGPWRRGLEPLLLAVFTFVATLALADICDPAVRGWYHGDSPYLGWLDVYWLLEPGRLTTWLVALIVALAMGVAVASGWSQRTGLRVLGGLLSLASVLGVAMLVISRPEVHVAKSGGGFTSHHAALPWPAMLGMIAGGLGGLWIAIGQGLTFRQSGLRRLAVVVGTLAAAVVLGSVTLADVLDEYQRQTFRPFQAKLVAVMWLQKGATVSKEHETFVHDKQTYVVLKDPKPLWFTDKDVRRVRLTKYRDYRGHHTGVSIRFADRLHGPIARRTRHLAKNRFHEAFYVDGKLYVVAPVMGAIYGGRILITDGPQDPAPTSARLHRALTR